METKKDIYHLWVQYTTKNEEEYFRKFIRGFVTIWETQLELDWENLPDWSVVKPDAGPHLSRLPEELLPAIGKFTYIAKDMTEKKLLNTEELENAEYLVRCLLVISRNFDNIPFIASCDYVSHMVGVAACVVHELLGSEGERGEGPQRLLLQLSRWLESMYDPYLTWRSFLRGTVANPRKLLLQPAALHVEVVPFVYDCFQTQLVQQQPAVAAQLLHLLGAVVSGARSALVRALEGRSEAGRQEGHNALRAICPATANVIMGVVAQSGAAPEVRTAAMQCFVMMVKVLDQSAPDQRQIEVGTLLQLYQEPLLELATAGGAGGALAGSVAALRQLLQPGGERLRQALVDSHTLEAVLAVLEEAARFPGHEQELAVECVAALSALLAGCPRAKERLLRTEGYARLRAALQPLGRPGRPLLQALLTLARTDPGPGPCPGAQGGALQDAEAALLLLGWLPEVGSEDQPWLVTCLAQLCTGDLRSKQLACSHGLILAVCAVVAQHSQLAPRAANELIRLLEVLATHSLMARELKEVFLLLRTDGESRFPFRLQLLHALSSVARQDDFGQARSYFDLQRDCDGISVPDIRQWAGAGAGFSFHCWLRLGEPDAATSTAPSRRQLFSLLTSAGVGLELFFRPDGCPVVSVNSRKESLTACAAEHSLSDGRWHSLAVSHAAARRPFGQNQLVLFIDGLQRLAVTIKSPSMSDGFSHCVIGRPVPRAGRTSAGGAEPSGAAERSLLPSLIQQVPAYLTLPLRSSAPLDPNVRSFPAGAQESVWGPAQALCGQLGTAALLQEPLSLAQARALQEAGPNGRLLLGPDEEAPGELASRLVFCFSPRACWDGVCLDLAPGARFRGHAGCDPCHTRSIKDAVNGIGGVAVLLPLLDCAGGPEDGPDLSFLSPSVERELSRLQRKDSAGSEDEWEILPCSSYSDWRLEQNPVSGFLSLLRNMVAGSAFNQQQLLSSKSLALVGWLMAKARADLIDVNVLMAVQLLLETARDAPNTMLLRSVHQHILFNFAIWARTQFHIMIGHVQYVSTVVKEDRKYFRRKFGVPFVLAVLRQYHSPCAHLTDEEAHTVRQALLGLVRTYLARDVALRDVSALVAFLCSVSDESLKKKRHRHQAEPVCAQLQEAVDSLAAHLQSKACRDQTVFLLYEPHHAELLHCLVAERGLQPATKLSVLRLLTALLRSELVFERSKARLRLQDPALPLLGGASPGLWPGLVAGLRGLPLEPALVAALLDLMLQTDSSAGGAGALALLHLLTAAPLSLKLEAARRLLTHCFMKAYAPRQLARQAGWQDCVTRLLVKQPLEHGPGPGLELPADAPDAAPDLMTFDEDVLQLEPAMCSQSPGSASVSRLSGAATFVEHEIKEVAETVTNAVAGNINYAADNITSVVASAYSVFRQKTVEMQESLEELGESVSRLKQRRSLASLGEEAPDSPGSPRPTRASAPSPAPAPLPELDSISLGNRSQSSSSTEELSAPDVPGGGLSDSLSLASGPDGEEPEPEPESDRDRDRAGVREDSPAGSPLEELPHWRRDSTQVDEAEELSFLVANVLFIVMWRGIDGSGKEAWKERGQVMACVNLLGLNNELHCSHLQLKLRLLELTAAAALAELRGEGEGPSPASAAAENAAQLLRWAYDLVVLDPHQDASKRASVKLLDAVLGLLDALLVFQDSPGDEWDEMAKLAFGILLACADHSSLELVAMATAKLHALVQTRPLSDPEEGGYLLSSLSHSLDRALQAGNQEHYSFLIPVVKALLEKLAGPLALAAQLPDLPQTQAGPAFFDNFQAYSRSPQWRQFIERKVRPLQHRYQGALAARLGDAMNTFWAESYEASKLALARRAQQEADSRARFTAQLLARFRAVRAREAALRRRLAERERLAERRLAARWRALAAFLRGPRGAWRAR